MTVKNIRDLFTGTPVKNPTLQELADENPVHTIYDQGYSDYVSCMPGDAKHPVEDYWRERAREAARLDYEAARRGHQRSEELTEEE